jgi:cbb3-type cytochrome oxidase subunit 1
MGRGAFHIVSIDFLFASIGLATINFTDYFEDTNLLLHLLALYFLGYGVAFLVTLIMSRKFENIYCKMWQWILMLVNLGLIYMGSY